MNKVKLIFITLLVFILLNAIIVILWPIRTNLKFSNYSPYSKEFINSLNLNDEESTELYLETWQRERLFEYDEFTGLKESVSINGKYVNISEENGRLVSNNPKQCEKNIFFYGGQIVFGYDVTDNQSIPYYFRDILKKNNFNYCVYNFGRRTYFSTQENILLQKHILNNKIESGDIIIFINGENETGNKELLNTFFIKNNYNNLHQKYWKLYRTGIKYFLSLLPVTQLVEVLAKKNNPKKINDNANVLDTKVSNKDIFNVYYKNLKIRKAICKEYNLECHNFLLFVNLKNIEKYEILRGTGDVNDLTYILENVGTKSVNNSLNPNTNKSISEEIYSFTIN